MSGPAPHYYYAPNVTLPPAVAFEKVVADVVADVNRVGRAVAFDWEGVRFWIEPGATMELVLEAYRIKEQKGEKLTGVVVRRERVSQVRRGRKFVP
ncbi:MAG: hypothetical protein MI755_16515 [Sphingomonadales bacterium]|nr:hypothetical protein [Sphingomonadales bacterium]